MTIISWLISTSSCTFRTNSSPVYNWSFTKMYVTFYSDHVAFNALYFVHQAFKFWCVSNSWIVQYFIHLNSDTSVIVPKGDVKLAKEIYMFLWLLDLFLLTYFWMLLTLLVQLEVSMQSQIGFAKMLQIWKAHFGALALYSRIFSDINPVYWEWQLGRITTLLLWSIQHLCEQQLTS